MSKKIRFEVFKRDSFKCQYCGRSAPDVLLEADHINPVAEGGENDILNLITSCADCNKGKGARTLDDNSIVVKQRQQLEELNERREQLEMMIEWRNGIDEVKDQALDVFMNTYEEKLGYTLTEQGQKSARKLLREYGLAEGLEAIDIAAEKESFEGNRIGYLSGICKARRAQKDKPYLKDLYYIRGILKYQIRHYDYNVREILDFLEDAYLAGVTIQEMTIIAKSVLYWHQFVDEVNPLRRK